ncbi:MAG: hypothetical protein MUC43_04105 [Pirellula sp.]|jgi:hypothetical protein|nr:hypothetical protein [Pirellula sp.]
MNENPYAATNTANASISEDTLGEDRSLLGIARNVFLAWEKLRIIYLGILTLFTLFLVGFSGFLNYSVVMSIVIGAFFANLLYFAGPVIDTYIRWLGYRSSWPRWFMFVCGTLLSLLLALGLLGSQLLPNQP